MSQEYCSYIIADRCFGVEGATLVEAVKNIYGFEPFATDKHEAEFKVVYAEDKDCPEVKERQYEFEADGVNSVFCSSDNGYVFKMLHDDGSKLDLWSVTGERVIYVKGSLTQQMLRFALWIAYGIMNVRDGRIPVHGSCIVNNGRAYLFLGESGTGKSTHTRLWRENIEGSVLLNDDSPIISVESDGVFIYGSPWSGKTPCYKQKKYPLGACVRLTQAPYNRIEKLSVLQAYAALHPSCPPEFAYDKDLYSGISNSLDKILGNVAVYHLACLPDADAARLSFETLSGNGK